MSALRGGWIAVGLVALGACGDPGGGGGGSFDTTSDTANGVLFPELLVDVLDSEPPEVSAPETIDSEPPDSAVPETQPETEVPEAEADTRPETAVDTADTADTAEAVDTQGPEDTVEIADVGPELTDAGPDLADVGSGACIYHTDCYPERVCAHWVTTGESRCSDPCAGDSDCAIGQVCSKVPGSLQVGFCQDAPAGLANGAPCALDAECRSGICSGYVCAPLCLDEAHCATPGMTCNPVGDLAIGLVSSVCTPDPAQSIALGRVCSADGITFDSAWCASGHCDVLNLAASTCAPICKSEADCAPAQECNIVIYAERERSEAMPYDPHFTQKTHDAVAGCFTPSATGTLPEGSPCTSRSQCRSSKCLALLPGSPQTYCTSFCTHDAQCPANMACKLEAMTMVSDWLAAGNNQAPGAWTLVRTCKFR